MKKNAIICLIKKPRNPEGYKNLLRRNRQLAENYKFFQDCDNIIFHEGNIPFKHQQYIIEESGPCIFRRVNPQCFSDSFASRFKPFEENWRIGYKHMCRFFGIQVFDHLHGYQNYWRLDDDCYLHSKVNYDVFAKLEESGSVYGYIREKRDSHQPTAKTLPALVRAYLDQNSEVEISNSCTIDSTNYYNNFHLSKIAFWNRPPVRKFLKYIDDSGGIYKYRWGDSTIQAIAVKLFSLPEERHLYSDILYEHGSHRWRNF